MRYGFVKSSAITPEIRVADCNYNADSIISYLKKANESEVELLCFPELCITGSTCGDLFFQPTLLDGAVSALDKILKNSADYPFVFTVGLPLLYEGKLYDCAAVCQRGHILGIVPKENLTRENARVFTAAPLSCDTMEILGCTVPFGIDILFQCEGHSALRLSVVFGDDLFAPNASAARHAAAGASVIVCPAACAETVGQTDFTRTILKAQSVQNLCSFIYANAGKGESTTDVVYAGHDLIVEKGNILSEALPFEENISTSDIDVEYLVSERMHDHLFETENQEHLIIPFSLSESDAALTRFIPVSPFVPSEKDQCTSLCREILAIQAAGLEKRLEHTHAKTAVIGISGGLDSTLALLAVVKTFRQMGRPLSDIIAVTMPCFGTTVRTRSNAERLCEALGVSLQHINITNTVLSNFSDIQQDEHTHDVTFENAQARVRTLVLMNLANRMGGMVIGTGDLSELALGWATYNGDHMSMYGVNASVPKTLLRHIVSYVAENSSDALRSVLQDILDTPVSPELLPAKDGEISQQTEEIVGPYELHDFFLYYAVRRAYTPSKIYFLAQQAFKGTYSDVTLLKWLRNFYHRFFAQQFKRSCLPDGPKVGSVSFSPRGDLYMPSDACATLWLNEVDRLTE